MSRTFTGNFSKYLKQYGLVKSKEQHKISLEQYYLEMIN